MIILALIFLGFVASTYGTIIGAGGGFLFVPVLVTFYNISPESAAATGLAIVFINAVAGLPIFFKQRRVLLRTGLLLAVGAFPGTFIGGELVKYSPDAVFYSLFAVLLIGLGLFLSLKKPSQVNNQPTNSEENRSLPQDKQNSDHILNLWKLLGIGSGLGIVSSFFGIGGGWLLVPILTYGLGFSIKTATATSIFSLALYSLVGLLPSIATGAVHWSIVAWSGIGVLAGAQTGAILSKKVKGVTITRLLSALVIIMGVNMIFQI
ncbi:sulfite exporter TauE/SafE family protein [Halobacillus shinanisalinarum]|uniref:Probable membrane transporter protein n=1 Tax=Halobacillus shinanisalinarum TaxID=2932258 RepID=A0ABY4GVP4_9BACI|nr:sulfite exporter TauE/SafE family protein [Halobacillus shinanisalinarum]UOQ91980.1 sulfite exporter TauE/SafE family protein [Halobacillus shinanisalinarum]